MAKKEFVWYFLVLKKGLNMLNELKFLLKKIK